MLDVIERLRFGYCLGGAQSEFGPELMLVVVGGRAEIVASADVERLE